MRPTIVIFVRISNLVWWLTETWLLPATDAHSEVMFTIFPNLLFCKLGRKYLLARNGPCICETGIQGDFCLTHHSHDAILFNQCLSGGICPLLRVHLKPSTIHEYIQSFVAAVTLSSCRDALFIRVVEIEYRCSSGFKLVAVSLLDVA